MPATVQELKCPGCGAPLSLDMKECPFCQSPVVISTFNSVSSMSAPTLNKYARMYSKMLADDEDQPALNSAIAMCYLKLGLYDKALSAFERAIEDDFDNSETYFYAAVCLLGGKKAFLAQREVINQALAYIDAANAIEPRGVYYLFEAYIKYDFFERKYLNTTPDYRACIDMALSYGVPDADMTMLFDTLKVANPFI